MADRDDLSPDAPFQKWTGEPAEGSGLGGVDPVNPADQSYDAHKKPSPFSEIGATGLAQYGGYLRDEFLPALSGYNADKVYREMWDNDAVIGAIVFAIQMLLRKVEWRVEPPEAATVEDIVAERFAERAAAAHEQQVAASQKIAATQAGLLQKPGQPGQPMPKPMPRSPLSQALPQSTPGVHQPITTPAGQPGPSPGGEVPGVTRPGANLPASDGPNSNPRGTIAQNSALEMEPGLGSGGKRAKQTPGYGPIRKSIRRFLKATGAMTGAIDPSAATAVDPDTNEPIEYALGQQSTDMTPEARKAEELAVFIETCLHDLDTSWADTLSQIITMIVWGWSFHELVYKKRNGPNPEYPEQGSKFTDGKIGWAKLAGRAQDTRLRWEFGERGEIMGLWQLAPPKFQLRYIPLSKALLFRTTGFKGNPEGRSVLRSAYRCVSADTDILTESGWKLAPDVTLDDRVATLNSQTECIEFQHPSDVWAYDHEGPMVHASSRFLDQLVTENHRMWVRREHKAEYEFIEAGDCGVRVSFKADGAWTASEQETITIGTQTIPVDAWARFLGWWLSEGHSWSNGSRHEVGLVQKEGPTADVIREVVHALPWSSFEKTDQRGLVRWIFSRKEIFDAVSYIGKSREKFIPEYVFGWSARQIGILLDNYHLGDGGILGGGTYKDRTYAGSSGIFTGSRHMADDLMRAALLAGYRPSMRLAVKDENHLGGDVWVVMLGKPFPQMRAHWETVDYSGTVHCVTTPNGIIYTRRNGKASWTGNSWFFKKRLEEYEAIGVERDAGGLVVIYVPAQMMSSSATPEEIAALEEIKKVARNIRRNEQEGIVFPIAYDPETNQPMFKIELLAGPSRVKGDVNVIITRYEQRMAMQVLAEFLFLGMGESGARALGETKTDLFTTALESFLDAIADVINTSAIPKLMQMNGEDPARSPKLTHGKLESVSLDEVAAMLTAIAGAGGDLFPDAQLEDALRDRIGLPPKSASSDL